MNQGDIDQDYLEMLFSDDPVLKTEALYNLTFEEVDEDTVKSIAKLIAI